MVFIEIPSPERGIVAEDIELLRAWVQVTHLGWVLMSASSSVEGLELSGVLHGSPPSLYDTSLHKLGTPMHLSLGRWIVFRGNLSPPTALQGMGMGEELPQSSRLEGNGA